MRKAAALVLFALAAAVLALTQQPDNATQATAPQTQNASQNSVPPADQNTINSGLDEVPANTEMRATLDTPLSSKTSKPGDRFTATISQPVSGKNGVVVPAGARIEGEVSESEQGKDVPGMHKLNLRLRDIVLANGQTVPLAASLVSVNHPRAQKMESEPQPEATTIAGSNFGEPLKGLAIGNLTGGGYVLATTGKDVTLPAQTGMVIKLDQPLATQQ